MAQTGDEFLKSWVGAYIAAEYRHIDQLDETVAELLDDASREGVSKEEIEKAASGNLAAYIQGQIVKYGGVE